MDKTDGHTPAILFPHCFIDPDRLKGAIGLFGSLEICLPWEMSLDADTAREEAAPFIKVLRPPEALKPGTGFGRRLAEYREWMRHQQDKSVLNFLGSLQGYDSSEEKSWEIRKRMRGERGQAETTLEDPGLKHHLVLHLARETEESRHTRRIPHRRDQGVELSAERGARRRRPKPGALRRSALPRGSSLWQGYQWCQIVEAWLGLFHQHLSNRRILLTLDPGLGDFLKERFEKARGEAPDRLFPEMTTIRLPGVPSTLSMDEISKTGRTFFPHRNFGGSGNRAKDRREQTPKRGMAEG